MMARQLTPFAAEPAKSTVRINAAAVPTIVQFYTGANGVPVVSVRVWNAGSEIVYIEFGDDNVEASDGGSMPLPPGQPPVVLRTNGGTHMSAVTHANTSVVFVTPGSGGI